MNIAFDMFFAKTEAMKRGIGRYSQNMIEAILKQETSDSFYYFYPDVSKGADYLKDQLQQFLYRNRIDLYHMTSPFNLFHLPANLFQAYSDTMLNKAWFGYTRVAATLYDVIPLVLEHQYMNDFVRPIYMKVIEMIRSCDIIYAISETTKTDAVRLTGMDPAKISVVMGGYDPKFKPLPTGAVPAAPLRYGIVKPYVLCTGGDDPRKNLARLIEAFVSANRLLANGYQLVIVYNSSEDEKRAMLEQARLLGDGGSLVVTGYVPDEDLVELYGGAALFAFPSLYEGFGLPIVEAMACGTPVLTSNNSSLAEIGGEAVYQVDPASRESIANGIVHMLGNPQLARELAVKGLEQARRYNWESVALKVTEGYEKVYRRRIAVFAPRHSFYPGAYGALFHTVPYLTNRGEIDVFVEELLDDSAEEERTEESPIAVYLHTEFDSRKTKYDYVIYEIGNEERHSFVVPYLAAMETIPGIVVLNGNHLHELIWRRTVERNDLHAYYRALDKEFGPAAAPLWMDAVLGGTALRSAVPVDRCYLEHAKSIIVYGSRTKDRLLHRQYRNVIEVPAPAMASAAGNPGGRAPFRFATVSADRSRPPYRLILRCLRKLIDEGCSSIVYTILSGGKNPSFEELGEWVAGLGLETYVRLKVEPQRAQIRRELAKAHAAIALSDPQADPSPDAALELIASGIPTILYDGDLCRLVPDDSAVKIQPDDEEESALLQAMSRLYRNKEERESLSARGLEYMGESHSLSGFSEALQEAVERSSSFGENPTVLWRIQESPGGVPQIRNT
ncbi:glycosyltransferase [Cohnella cellulosilytica]|uniref:Glycosyltransferase n=1 Tax=Cohnella cellulosilytica TaxID=986710 RepID=A0ABW2FI82_9BACL